MCHLLVPYTTGFPFFSLTQKRTAFSFIFNLYQNNAGNLGVTGNSKKNEYSIVPVVFPINISQ